MPIVLPMEPTMSEKKHAAIIQAAIHEFNASGYFAATMNSISKRAKVSKRTTYNHFANKEVLFRTIVKHVCEAVEQATDMPYDPTRSIEEQLTELARRQLALARSEDFLTMTRVTLPVSMRNPDLVPDLFVKIRLGDTGLGRWLEQANKQGALQLDHPKEAGRRFGAMIFEFAFWPIVTNIAPPPTHEEGEKIVAETVTLFLNGCQPR